MAAHACGGEALGTWKLNHACYMVLEQPQLDFCPTATASVAVQQASGTVSFGDTTFTRDIALTATLIFHLPASCKQQTGGTLSCSDFSSDPSDPDAITCSTEASGDCNCSRDIDAPQHDAGRCLASGTQLKADRWTMDYCVQGKHLTLQPALDMSMGSMGDAKVLLQMSFDKS